MNKLQDINCPSVLNPIYSDRQTFKSSLVTLAKGRLAKIRAQEIYAKKVEAFTDLTKSISPDVTGIMNINQDTLNKADRLESSNTIHHHVDSKIHVEKAYSKPIIDWVSQCLDEGHIEPSQPCVGRAIGWPVRSFKKSSLLIDFRICCMKNGLPEKDNIRDNSFIEILDAIFDAEEDRYLFPSLEECRYRFNSIIIEKS